MKIDTRILQSPINCIVLLSIIGGILYMLFPGSIYYGMYISDNTLVERIIQLCLYSILHGGWLHMISNSIFFLFIGRVIEATHGRGYVWGLWVWTTLFVGFVLMLLSPYPTIGGSGFAMALLSLYTLDFYKRKDPEYKGGIVFIALNIAIGFYGNISLLGHLGGAVAGFLYGILIKK